MRDNYKSSVGLSFVLALMMVILLFLMMRHDHFHIRDLQHRVGQLEQQVNKQ